MGGVDGRSTSSLASAITSAAPWDFKISARSVPRVCAFSNKLLFTFLAVIPVYCLVSKCRCFLFFKNNN